MRNRGRSPTRAIEVITSGPAAASSSGTRKMRWGARRAGQLFRRRRMALLVLRPLHASLEPLDLAGGVDDVLGTGVERVAIRADLDADRIHGRADRERGPAHAVDLRLMVLRMNIGLHGLAPGIPRPPRPLTFLN